MYKVMGPYIYRRHKKFMGPTSYKHIIFLLGTTAMATLPFSHTASAQTVSSGSGTVVNAGEVTASSGALNTLLKLPTKREIFNSTQSIKVVGRKQIKALGPAAGAAQALAVAPGVSIEADGTSGSPRAGISINGMKTGWGNIAGNSNDGTVMVTFDGVPMVDPAYGVWQASEIPNLSFIKGVSVTYGPGYPINRWYDNIGGGLNFVPIEPTAKAQADIGGYFGSYGARGTNFSFDTGEHDGWSAVFAGTIGRSGNYLSGYGFDNPSNNYAYYAKIIKKFPGGRISFGGFASRASAYRPVPIPVSPNSQVTINGDNPITGNPYPGPVYSQQMTGFYNTLPKSIYYKRIPIRTYLIYSKFFDRLGSISSFHNIIFYRYGERIHEHYDNYGQSNNVLIQYFNAHSQTFGDKAYFTFKLPYNTLSIGGYAVYNKFNSFLDYYNPNNPAVYSSGPNVGQPVLINGTPVNYSLAIPHNFHNSFLYETNLAAFAQDVIRPNKNIRLTPGLSVVSMHTDFVNNSLAAFPYNTTTGLDSVVGVNGDRRPNSSTNFVEFEPSIGANYKINKNIALYANYSTAYKGVGGASGTYAHFVASTLKPQKSNQYQLGIKILIPNAPYLHHAIFSANYYHLNDLNQIIPIPIANQNYKRFASGSSVFHGFNIYFEDDPKYNIHVYANASFESANYSNYVTGGQSYNGLPISNVPWVTFNSGLYYSFFQTNILYQPRIWYQYTGSQNIYNNNTGLPTRNKLGGYGILNLGMKVALATPKTTFVHAVDFNVDLLNVLNNKYNAFEYYSGGGYYGVPGQLLAEPGAPFTAYGSLNVKFR